MDVVCVGEPQKWKKANMPIPLTCSVDWIFKVVSIDMFLCIHIGGGYLSVQSLDVWSGIGAAPWGNFRGRCRRCEPLMISR